MSDSEWLPETEPTKRVSVVTIDRRPLSERSKLSDRGLVDFRRVCDRMGILDRDTDTIMPPSSYS
jgi:hypothetical protein